MAQRFARYEGEVLALEQVLAEPGRAAFVQEARDVGEDVEGAARMRRGELERTQPLKQRRASIREGATHHLDLGRLLDQSRLVGGLRDRIR